MPDEPTESSFLWPKRIKDQFSLHKLRRCCSFLSKYKKIPILREILHRNYILPSPTLLFSNLALDWVLKKEDLARDCESCSIEHKVSRKESEIAMKERELFVR